MKTSHSRPALVARTGRTRAGCSSEWCLKTCVCSRRHVAEHSVPGRTARQTVHCMTCWQHLQHNIASNTTTTSSQRRCWWEVGARSDQQSQRSRFNSCCRRQPSRSARCRVNHCNRATSLQLTSITAASIDSLINSLRHDAYFFRTQYPTQTKHKLVTKIRLNLSPQFR